VSIKCGNYVGIAVVCAAGILLSGFAPAHRVTAEKVDYKGWKNALRIQNGDAELIVTLDVGPRIISYRLFNEANVFKEFTDQLGKSGEKDWQIRGGHRLTVAPEDPARSYVPDNGPVKYRQENTQFLFSGGPETADGLQKEIGLRLAPSGSRVTIIHSITNTGTKVAKLAPWASTAMAPGGVEIIPLPPKKDYPGAPPDADAPAMYAPNQTLALWPYFDFRDDRFTFGSRYITVRQKSKHGPSKMGLAHRMGWVAYLNQGTLFVRRFKYDEGKAYPDHGCNLATFTNDYMLEIEVLGPLVNLAPGATVTLTEQWELIANVEDFSAEAGIDLNVLSKINRD
jgi:hypothetical protein